MKDIWVRYARPDESEQIVAWSARIKDLNLADPELASYPTLRVLCAHSDGKVLLYTPSQEALVLEGLAPNPEATELEIAMALKQTIARYAGIAEDRGIREIYFLCKDERVVKIARRHGFDIMPWTCLCLDVKDLERKRQPGDLEKSAEAE